MINIPSKKRLSSISQSVTLHTCIPCGFLSPILLNLNLNLHETQKSKLLTSISEKSHAQNACKTLILIKAELLEIPGYNIIALFWTTWNNKVWVLDDWIKKKSQLSCQEFNIPVSFPGSPSWQRRVHIILGEAFTELHPGEI